MEVANAALKISNAAKHIPEALAGIEMSVENQKVFVGLAEKLRGQALDLHRRTEKGALLNPANAIEELTSTCNACHSLFRGTKSGHI